MWTSTSTGSREGPLAVVPLVDSPAAVLQVEAFLVVGLWAAGNLSP